MHIIKTIWVLLWGLAISTTEERTEEWLSDSHCRSVVEGDTGYIQFHFSEVIDTDSHGLFLFIKRNEGPDILRCTQTPQAQAADCMVLDDRFEMGGLVGMTFTLIIINATTDVQGLYVLRMTSPSNHRIDCNFTISDERDGKTNEHQTGQDIPIHTLVVLITTVVIVVTVFAVVFCIYTRRKRKYLLGLRKDSAGIHVCTANNTDAEAPTLPHAKEEDVSLLDSPDSTTVYIDWDISTVEEKELLLQNKPGSFLVRKSTIGRYCNVLAVNCNGTYQTFLMEENANNIKLNAADRTFKSLSDLVEYYKLNVIKTRDGGVYCKLTYPCTSDLRKKNEHSQENHRDWYRPSSSIGKAEKDPPTIIAGDDSDEAFNLKKNMDMEEMALRITEREPLLRNGQGSFLIRRSKTDPTEHLLAVTFNGGVEYFQIKEQEHIFGLEAATITFQSLYDLEEYYKKHQIRTEEDVVYCRLSDTGTKDTQIDGYIHDKITRQEEKDLLQRNGSGSFLIRRSWTGPHEILAVNCNKVIEHFTIVDCKTYFILQEAGTPFKSLPEMVEHYTRQKIKSAGGTFYCKLTHPCTRLWEEDSEKNEVPSKNGMQTKTASYNDPADKPSAIHTETVDGETEV